MLSLLIAILGGTAMAGRWLEGQALLAEGQVLTDRDVIVTDATKPSGGSVQIRYEFTVSGQTVRGSAVVPESYADHTKNNGIVAVTYLPRNTSTHRFGYLSRQEIEREFVFDFLGLTLTAGLFGGLALALRGKIRRDASIFRSWDAVAAQVVASQKKPTGYRLQLRYVDPGNRIRAVDVLAIRPAAPGAFVDLMLNPQDPSQFRLRETLTTVEAAS